MKCVHFVLSTCRGWRCPCCTSLLGRLSIFFSVFLSCSCHPLCQKQPVWSARQVTSGICGRKSSDFSRWFSARCWSFYDIFVFDFRLPFCVSLPVFPMQQVQPTGVCRQDCSRLAAWLSASTTKGVYHVYRVQYPHISATSVKMLCYQMCLFFSRFWMTIRQRTSSSSSTTVGSLPVGVWRHSYYRCPPLPI